jgi:hypothetical protein
MSGARLPRLCLGVSDLLIGCPIVFLTLSINQLQGKYVLLQLLRKDIETLEG